MMTLHLDRDAFVTIIKAASQSSGISEDILEKDYYVTLLLQELSDKQNTLKAYFKGGTCLYKIYLPMRRFSEDIDLTVDIRNISNSQAKKRLEHSSKNYMCLNLDTNNSANTNNKGSITQIYSYSSCFDIREDPLQRFEKVKVEATSFTISEPVEKNNIHTLLIDSIPKNIVNKVIHKYNMGDFSIENITLERIFCDKILAAEFYIQRKDYFDVAKHLYDIVSMLDMSRILNILRDAEMFVNYMSYKRIEETVRIGSNFFEKPFALFQLWEEVSNSVELKQAFNDMQRKYVFDDKLYMDYNFVRRKMDTLRIRLIAIDMIEQPMLKSDVFKSKRAMYNPIFIALTKDLTEEQRIKVLSVLPDAWERLDKQLLEDHINMIVNSL